jgi:hypothetical protein
VIVSNEADRIEMDGYIKGVEQVAAAAGLLAAEERNFGYAAGAYGLWQGGSSGANRFGAHAAGFRLEPRASGTSQPRAQ